ncbi:MAG: AbrB/MazE/SpoVT family DNA-binding domain-containing protein [Pseudomonadota bacterium]
MKIRLRKWGNSLALRIPKSFAVEVGLQNQSPVELTVADGTLIIEPVVEPGATLKQLLDRVTDDNVHHEVDAGSDPGYSFGVIATHSVLCS